VVAKGKGSWFGVFWGLKCLTERQARESGEGGRVLRGKKKLGVTGSSREMGFSS